jgi:hypothetical protein
MFSSKRCKQNSRKHELFEVGGLGLPAFFLAGALTLFISPEHSESAQRNGFSIEDPLIPLEERYWAAGRRVMVFLLLIPLNLF